jgi:hypothetical protein
MAFKASISTKFTTANFSQIGHKMWKVGGQKLIYTLKWTVSERIFTKLALVGQILCGKNLYTELHENVTKGLAANTWSQKDIHGRHTVLVLAHKERRTGRYERQETTITTATWTACVADEELVLALKVVEPI